MLLAWEEGSYVVACFRSRSASGSAIFPAQANTSRLGSRARGRAACPVRDFDTRDALHSRGHVVPLVPPFLLDQRQQQRVKKCLFDGVRPRAPISEPEAQGGSQQVLQRPLLEDQRQQPHGNLGELFSCSVGTTARNKRKAKLKKIKNK